VKVQPRKRVEVFCKANGEDLFNDMLAGCFTEATWKAWEKVSLLYAEAVAGDKARVAFFESRLEEFETQAGLDGCELGMGFGGAK